MKKGGIVGCLQFKFVCHRHVEHANRGYSINASDVTNSSTIISKRCFLRSFNNQNWIVIYCDTSKRLSGYTCVYLTATRDCWTYFNFTTVRSNILSKSRPTELNTLSNWMISAPNIQNMVVANSYHYILLFGEDLVQCVVQNGIYVVWSSARVFCNDSEFGDLEFLL